MFAQLPPRVVQRLVQRVAVGVEPLSENVDRDAVHRKRHEDAALVRCQHLLDRLLQCAEQLVLLGLGVRSEARVREHAPALRLERHLAPLPGALSELDRRLVEANL
jgi:hypothetical protein